jgi:hypothetical protein
LVQQRLAVFLAVLAGALFALLVLLVNVARAGGVIAAEIRHAQNDYMDRAQSSPLGEANALQLGQCLRRAMLKVALGRLQHDDAWVMATRVQALPNCMRDLPPLAALSSPELAAFPSVLTGAPTSMANHALTLAPADQLPRRR